LASENEEEIYEIVRITGLRDGICSLNFANTKEICAQFVMMSVMQKISSRYPTDQSVARREAPVFIRT
jgi:hypothetical protein